LVDFVECIGHKQYWEDRMRKIALAVRIREVVECGCCPIIEDVVKKIAEYLVDGLGYTDGEMYSDEGTNQIDLLYNYEKWTYTDRRTDHAGTVQPHA
jgi:hypothetical protein